MNSEARGRTPTRRSSSSCAANWGCSVLVGRPSGNLTQRGEGVGLEAVARRARYAFLRQTAERLGARYVVTAHTADDQVETILHRIVRGTGIAGLSGMARVRPLGEAATLIRPLLDVRRAEVHRLPRRPGPTVLHRRDERGHATDEEPDPTRVAADAGRALQSPRGRRPAAAGLPGRRSHHPGRRHSSTH